MSAAEVQILNFGLKMGRLRDALMVDTVSRCGCLRERERRIWEFSGLFRGKLPLTMWRISIALGRKGDR